VESLHGEKKPEGPTKEHTEIKRGRGGESPWGKKRGDFPNTSSLRAEGNRQNAPGRTQEKEKRLKRGFLMRFLEVTRKKRKKV